MEPEMIHSQHGMVNHYYHKMESDAMYKAYYHCKKAYKYMKKAMKYAHCHKPRYPKYMESSSCKESSSY